MPEGDPERVQKLTEELQFVARIDDHLTKLVGIGWDAHNVRSGIALAEWFRSALEHLDQAAHAIRNRRNHLEAMLEVPPPAATEEERDDEGGEA